MKAILTVVFVISISTSFVQSAKAMPPNEWHSEAYNRNLQSWMETVQKRITKQPKYHDFVRGIGEQTIHVTCQLTSDGDLGNLQLVAALKSSKADQMALLLLRNCSSLPKPPASIAYRKKLLITFDRLGVSVAFVPFDSWGPARFI